MAFFDNLLAPFSSAPAEKAAQAQQDAIRQGYGQLSDLYGQGRGALTSNFQSGLAPVTENIQRAGAGTDQLMRLLGIGGGSPGDIQRQLEATPGYQFQLQQGTENALRNAGRAGTLASGGTLADLMKFGQGLAGTTYQNAVGNLQPFLNYGTQAAGQGLQGYSALGGSLADLFSGQGEAAYGAQTGIGNAQANAALAPYNAGKNIWGALGSIAGLGSNLLGGGMPGAAKSLFSGFGGGSPTGPVGNFGWKNPDYRTS